MNPEEKEYILFCDESDRKGAFYSNFYGGVRVPASSLTQVNSKLLAKKKELGLISEIKWEKADASVVDRYQAFIHEFFILMGEGHLHMRVMFTQNARVPTGLSQLQKANEYFLLYYQFLKHGFGLAHMPRHVVPPRIRIYLDEIGDTREQIANFKGYVLGLVSNKDIRAAGGIRMDASMITEVRSHDHIVVQALDVVLGSMTFRLNNKHKAIPEGQHRRGKRTVAKEKLYKFILQEIKQITGKQGFNIGISTELNDGEFTPWTAPYLHWLFEPSANVFDPTKAKP